MFESYKIAVKVTLLDEVSRPIALLASHFIKTEEAATRLQGRMNTMRAFFAGGVGLMGAGATLAAPLLYAIDKAAELQKQMIGVQIASRGTAEQMEAMRAVIEKTAGVTIFSNIDVAKMAKIVATGTGLGAEDVTKLLPVYARFADVQSLMKGTPYTQSIADAVRLAHTAQHYDPKGLADYLDLLTKASFIVPGGLGEVGHALKYSQGLAKTALGVDDTQMVLLTSLLNRLGFAGSRGGTNLIAAMSRTIPGIFGSGLLTGKSNEALRAMGMTDEHGKSLAFANGKFDSFAWMGHLAQYVQREMASHPEAIARQDIAKNFQHAFGTQGGRVASLLSSPQAIEQLRQIGEIFSQYGGVEAVQKRFADESVAQQYMNAKTNFISAMTELGITLLPAATAALKTFNTYIGDVIQWMTKNPEKVKEYAKNIAIFAGALFALGAISTTTSAIIGLTTVIGGLRAAGVAAAAASAGFGLLATKLGAISGALGAGYLIGEGINSLGPEGDLGGYLGGKLYEWLHPEVGKQAIAPSTLAHRRGVIDRHVTENAGKKAPVQVTTNINLDGRKLAKAVTQYQVRGMSGPQAGVSDVDGRAVLVPSGSGEY